MAAADRNHGYAIRRFSLLKAVTLTLVLGGVALGAWLGLSATPNQGFPVAQVAIPKDDTAIVNRPNRLDGLTMRDSVGPGEPAPAMPGPNLGNEGKPKLGNGDKGNESINSGVVRIIDPTAPLEADLPGTEQGPIKLARAPIADLVERSEFGALPRMSADGRKPAQAYARPAPPAVAGRDMVRIAVIIGGLGISTSGTSTAIQMLPAAVTLAFAPYGNNLQGLVDRARGQGHEVMLQVPMEPFDYPDNDPGPHTLLTSLKQPENLTRLKWLMGRFTGYTGITNYMGAKFTATEDVLQPIMAQISARGLSYLDDGASPRSRAGPLARASGTPFSRANVMLDAEQSSTAIGEALRKLETIAMEKGFAIGVGTALPITIKSVAEWANGLAKRGIVLVPVSAIAATEQN